MEQCNQQSDELKSPVANRVHIATQHSLYCTVFVLYRFDVFCVQISSQVIFCVIWSPVYSVNFLAAYYLVCLNLFLCGPCYGSFLCKLIVFYITLIRELGVDLRVSFEIRTQLRRDNRTSCGGTRFAERGSRLDCELSRSRPRPRRSVTSWMRPFSQLFWAVRM